MKNKDKSKDTKAFYQFLVEHGQLFPFIQLLGNTNYKTLKKHCEKNKPSKFISRAYTIGINGLHGTPFLDPIEWAKLSVTWLCELQKGTNIINKTKNYETKNY